MLFSKHFLPYSSHEQWKYLFLPYVDVPVNAKLFRNGEKARVMYSKMKGVPGLYASVSNVTHPSDAFDNAYVSACGIAELASQKIAITDLVTPYASFSVILANASVGLSWYKNMVKTMSMHGPYGSTESILTNGEYIAPIFTWDSKGLVFFFWIENFFLKIA